MYKITNSCLDKINVYRHEFLNNFHLVLFPDLNVLQQKVGKEWLKILGPIKKGLKKKTKNSSVWFDFEKWTELRKRWIQSGYVILAENFSICTCTFIQLSMALRVMPALLTCYKIVLEHKEKKKCLALSKDEWLFLLYSQKPLCN